LVFFIKMRKLRRLSGIIFLLALGLLYSAETSYYHPNTFTPKDGVFIPRMNSNYEFNSYRLTLFNRWGDVIFESNDVKVGWDGNQEYEGETCESDDGTYTWKIEYKLSNDPETKVVLGHVTLIR
jgi:gliding motility-associated-like protein